MKIFKGMKGKKYIVIAWIIIAFQLLLPIRWWYYISKFIGCSNILYLHIALSVIGIAMPIIFIIKTEYVMRKYRVTIDLDAFEILVSANNKAEAKRKAIERLQRKKITSLIRKSWPNNKKEVYVDEK